MAKRRKFAGVGAASDRVADSGNAGRIRAAAFGVVLGYVATLAVTFFDRFWIIDTQGHPVLEDFVAFWAAGKLTLHAAASAAYDPHLQHAAEVAVIGHGFAGTLGWSYPPVFLFVAALLARMPYVVAFLAWCAGTAALYAGAVAACARSRMWALFACAAPWVLTAAMPGQNGFLTATFFGFALLFVEERPILGAFFLGLLSYKPQFGVLFPLALAAGRYWRAFIGAGLVATAVNAAACTVFGLDTLGAFFHSLSGVAATHLGTTGVAWNKLQSIYGLVRSCGGTPQLASFAQFSMSTILACSVFVAWRAPLPFALKAAILAAAAPLATPYVFVYDLPILGVAVAFLHRHRNFDSVEVGLLALTAPCIFAFLWLPMPTAFFASLAVAAIAARRASVYFPRMRMSPSWATDATSVPSSE